jgi:hypothetical protein
VIAETKENLTDMRAKESIEAFGDPVYSELEKTYGKYLLIPFDVPKIVPHDVGKFVDFYDLHAKFAVKMQGDIAEDLLKDDRPEGKTPYRSIDSCASTNKMIWAKNHVPEIFTEFPELFEQIHDYFPFLDRGFMWTMWSSAKDIIPHRDLRSMLDMPIRLRIKLYDDNPEESLSLQLAPVDKPIPETYRLNIPQDTNSFAWNNLRTRHLSKYTHRHMKILFISFANYSGIKMNQYVDLLDRSIAKYPKNVIVDTHTHISDYIHV